MNKIIKFFKKRKASMLHLLGSLVLLAVAAGIGIMLGLDKTNGIDKYIDEAVEYFEEGNWAAFYQYSETIDNDFINEVFFAKVATDTYGDISKVDVTVESVNEEENSAEVEISYKGANGNSNTYVLDFSMKDEKNYVFFPQWKLDIEDFIIRDCNLTVPSGFAVYMDGVMLTEDNARIKKEQSSGNDLYTIPRLFKGEHTVYLQKQGVEVEEIQLTWNEDKSTYTMTVDELQLVQSQTDAIKEDAKNIVIGMYTAIFNEGGTDDVSVHFKQDEATLAMLTAVYDNMLAAIKPDDGSTLNSMDITAFNQDVFDYTYPNQVDVTVSFDCTFKATGPRSSKGGVRKKYEGTSQSQITMHFEKGEADWECTQLNMECIDYSEPEETE